MQQPADVARRRKGGVTRGREGCATIGDLKTSWHDKRTRGGCGETTRWQRVSATLEEAWQRHGGVSGGDGSAKCGGGAQHDDGSAVAAAQRLRRW